MLLRSAISWLNEVRHGWTSAKILKKSLSSTQVIIEHGTDVNISTKLGAKVSIRCRSPQLRLKISAWSYLCWTEMVLQLSYLPSQTYSKVHCSRIQNPMFWILIYWKLMFKQVFVTNIIIKSPIWFCHQHQCNRWNGSFFLNFQWMNSQGIQPLLLKADRENW